MADRNPLLLIVPSPPPPEGEGPHAFRVANELALRHDAELIYCEGAPSQVWDAVGAARVAPLVIAKGRWAQEQGYAAVIISCMLDPGLHTLHRELSIPVVGAGAAAFATAALIGRRPALVYPGSTKVYSLHEDRERTLALLIDDARRQIGLGADVLIPACTELDRYAAELQQNVGLPVVPCVQVALQSAETLVEFRLKTAHRTPLNGRWAWFMRHMGRGARRAFNMLRV